jgi:hypothetical protein
MSLDPIDAVISFYLMSVKYPFYTIQELNIMSLERFGGNFESFNYFFLCHSLYISITSLFHVAAKLCGYYVWMDGWMDGWMHGVRTSEDIKDMFAVVCVM